MVTYMEKVCRSVKSRRELIRRLEEVIGKNDILESRLEKTKLLARERSRDAKGSWKLLQTIFDKMPMGMMLVEGSQMNIVQMSRHGLAMFELTEKQVRNLPFSEFAKLMSVRQYGCVSNMKPEDSTVYKACIYGEVTNNKEVEMHLHSGKSIVITVSSTPLKHTGKVIGSITCWKDITVCKSQKEQLHIIVEKLRKSVSGVIQAMTRVTETRDPYTAGHQSKVAELATTIAHEMKLSESVCEAVNMAATLHDIGKIYVPAEILSRPGTLSELEYGIIKTHPKEGYNILKEIEFPWPIATITLQHHERWNGSGYPDGLSGNDILLEARIIAVADAVEAMTFHRPYKNVVGLDCALKHIAAESGKLYDPRIVNTTLAMFKDGKFKFKE